MTKIKPLRGVVRRGFMFGLVVVGVAACGANEGVLRSGNLASPYPTAEARADSFENDLEDVKRADFTWLYVIRRRDGEILSADDRTAIRAATLDANRRVLSDDDKAVIVGSNYEATVAALEPLKKRFDVADLSPERPAVTPQTPVNSNQAGK